MCDFVREGDYVVLIKNFEPDNMKIIPAVRESTVHYGKLHFDPSPLLGARLGQVFEIVGQTMKPIDNFDDFNEELSNVVASRMTNLEDKTHFSQEKIIKNKKKKAHANVVTVMKPSLLHINEMLFARRKIGGLRADVLSQILTLSNIQAGSRCVIVDHNLGMITSAVMSRILPHGTCIQIVPDYETMCTSRRTMNMLNIKEEDCLDNLAAITIRDVHRISVGTDTFELDSAAAQMRSKERIHRLENCSEVSLSDQEYTSGQEGDIETDLKRTRLDPELKEKLHQSLIKKSSNREQRYRERMLARAYLKEQSLDSLIIVVQNDEPLSLLKLLYPSILPSRPFVIYSDLIQPLIECQQYLKNESLALSMQVSESWIRHFQVLPDRTRPDMNTTGYGGYILSGTKANFRARIESSDIPMQGQEVIHNQSVNQQ